jgi:pimeloyl-ACP methyl ester carboxylesterase
MTTADIPGHHGIVYYIDGAGGGGLVSNWGRGVKRGLERGGFNGEFQEFNWQTRLGVIADQDSSVDYKREQARKLANSIVVYARQHPGEPINIIGLSAGTAIAIYTLEELPTWCPVDVVVLLGSSIDANYNLTRALERVDDDIYVFTSSRDNVLKMFVPITGTADREYAGREVAGIRGFVMPPHLDQNSKALYTKVVNIRWNRSYAKTGNFGGHTGGTHPAFVAEYITPLLIPEGPRNLYAKSDETASTMR